jgi:hypothetical protein
MGRGFSVWMPIKLWTAISMEEGSGTLLVLFTKMIGLKIGQSLLPLPKGP